MNKLISIITPIYNAENYLDKTISSVLNQSYQNWELLLINDGSTDRSDQIVKSFKDPRIRYYEQPNKGVGAARNLGLAHMNGGCFCFLDADDVFLEDSLSSRIKIMNDNEEIDYVDGCVQYVDSELNKLIKRYTPNFRGSPLPKLLKLDSSCLFGNTWLIRHHKEVNYQFDEGMTHAEDVYFYITVSSQRNGGLYDYVEKDILLYRKGNGTAMSDLRGLENGYYKLIRNLRRSTSVEKSELFRLRFKVAKIMFLSHLIDGRDPFSAFRCLFKYLL